MAQQTDDKSAGGPSLWRLSGLGLELGGAVVALTLIGWWLDGRWGTQPWGAGIGFVLGFVGGFYLFIKEVAGINKGVQPPKWPEKKPAERPEDETDDHDKHDA